MDETTWVRPFGGGKDSRRSIVLPSIYTVARAHNAVPSWRHPHSAAECHHTVL